MQTLEEQVARAYQQYSTRKDDLAKNTFMTSMKEQNTVLYYKVLKTSDPPTYPNEPPMPDIVSFQLIQDHLKEMFSIIYTPTEGDAIANFSRLFRRPDGCFLNIEDIDRVDADMAQWGEPDDIDLIVVSDGEQVQSS